MIRRNVKMKNPDDDGYSWQKYGQKDILGAKYPRYVRTDYYLIKAHRLIVDSSVDMEGLG
jgi:hypothetical protein